MLLMKGSSAVKDGLLLIMTDICGFAAREGKSQRSRKISRTHLAEPLLFLNNWLTTPTGNQKSRLMSIIIKQIQPDAPFGSSKWQLVRLNMWGGEKKKTAPIVRFTGAASQSLVSLHLMAKSFSCYMCPVWPALEKDIKIILRLQSLLQTVCPRVEGWKSRAKLRWCGRLAPAGTRDTKQIQSKRAVT